MGIKLLCIHSALSGQNATEQTHFLSTMCLRYSKRPKPDCELCELCSLTRRIHSLISSYNTLLITPPSPNLYYTYNYYKYV